MKHTNKFTNTDKIIAERIRLRRIMLKLSQSDLAKSCGISFQQIQKYEACKNKITCARLFQISQILKVPVDFFFDDTFGEPNKLYKTESLEVLNLYWGLSKNTRKNIVLNLLKSLN